MPLRNARPLTFRPKGLSDTQDGTNAFPGAMMALVNLVPSPTTDNVFVPRPAAQQIGNFSPFNNPGLVSAILVLGTRVYGMIGSDRFPGQDEPFCFDLITQAYIVVRGVTAANTPATQSPFGEWVPPTIVAVTNGRIIVTHPGFPGGSGPYFGWFDVSGFVSATVKGNLTTGSPVIQSIQTVDGNSAPVLAGVQPGQAISGAGIPAGATVVSATNGSFTINGTGDTHTSTLIDNLMFSTASVQVGMSVSGPGVPTGATVASIPSASSITISVATTATATGVAINVSGGGTITISANAMSTATGSALLIQGGSAGSPLWGAGNTNGFPLVGVPTCVGQFNGRAYYGVGNAAVPSDSLNPTQQTTVNALILGDSTPVTALVGLPLNNTVTGGVVAALIAFKAAESLFQITGDPATANLHQDEINGSVGTLAPNTICATPQGLAYISIDGLRVLTLSGQITEPIGTNGQGVNTPFLNALNPSRMCAAYNQDIYRVSVQNGAADGQPTVEYWYDFDHKKIWTGPHSFPSTLIAPYAAGGSAQPFIMAPKAVPASLFTSAVIPTAVTTYSENGVSLTWTFRTSLCPDNQDMANNRVIETALMLALAQSDTIRVRSIDETGRTLDTVYITGVTLKPTLWGQFRWGRANWSGSPGAAVWGAVNWGAFNWGAQIGPFGQYRVAWTGPLDFKQMSLELTGTSTPGQSLGNMYVKFQPTGFLTQGLGNS